MLSKVFLMSNKLVTFAKGVTRVTPLAKVTDQLLMSNNLLSVLFAAIFSDLLVKRKIIHKRNMSKN